MALFRTYPDSTPITVGASPDGDNVCIITNSVNVSSECTRLLDTRDVKFVELLSVYYFGVAIIAKPNLGD